MMIAMSIPNIIAMYILAPEVKKDLKAYCQKYQVGKFVNRDWLAEVPVTVKADDKEVLCPNSKL